MILDRFENIAHYYSLIPSLESAMKLFSSGEVEKLEPGMHVFDDVHPFKIACSHQETRLPEEGFLEFHRDYIDMQVVLSGEELLGWAPLTECTITTTYNAENDFGKAHGDADFVTLIPGRFALLFPADAHNPSCAIDGVKSMVKKVVFKLPVVR